MWASERSANPERRMEAAARMDFIFLFGGWMERSSGEERRGEERRGEEREREESVR